MQSLRVITSALVLTVLLLAGSGGSALAQIDDSGFTEDGTYQSLFGYELTWEDPWVMNMTESGYQTEEWQDFLYLQHDDLFSEVYIYASAGIGSNYQTIEGSLGGLSDAYDDLKLYELDGDENDAWAVVSFEIAGSEAVFYLRSFFTEDLSSSVFVQMYSEPEQFEEALADFEEFVAFDGESAHVGQDAAEIAELIDSGETLEVPGTFANLNNDDEEDDEDGTDENEDLKLPEEEEEDTGDDSSSTPEDDEDEDTTPSDEDDADSSDEDAEEPEDAEDPEDTADDENTGVVEPGLWVSPQFDTEVEWDSDIWVTEAFTGGTSSHEDGAVDMVTLLNTKVDAQLVVSVYGIGDSDADELVSFLIDWYENDESPRGMIVDDVDTDGDLTIVTFTFGGENPLGTGYAEIRVDEDAGTVTLVELSSTFQDADDAVDSATDTVEIDGDEPFVETPELPEED